MTPDRNIPNFEKEEYAAEVRRLEGKLPITKVPVEFCFARLYAGLLQNEKGLKLPHTEQAGLLFNNDLTGRTARNEISTNYAIRYANVMSLLKLRNEKDFAYFGFTTKTLNQAILEEAVNLYSARTISTHRLLARGAYKLLTGNSEAITQKSASQTYLAVETKVEIACARPGNAEHIISLATAFFERTKQP